MVNQTNSQTQFLLLFRDVQNLESDLAQAKADADRFKNEVLQGRKKMDILKGVMGYELAEVGDEDSVEASTIVGLVRSDINRLAGSLPKATLRDALIELHSRWQETAIERNTLKSQVEKLSAGSSTN
jgi:hypothetical protein